MTTHEECIKHNLVAPLNVNKVPFETQYSRMDPEKFVEYNFKLGCLPQILLGPLLNTLFHLMVNEIF